MTDIDYTKVVEKLTEVLDILKKEKTEKTEKIEEKPEGKSECKSECKPESKGCPLRKIMSEEEFEKMEKTLTKEISGECVCVNCPLERYNNKQESPFVSIILFMLIISFFIFLGKFIRGFYSLE